MAQIRKYATGDKEQLTNLDRLNTPPPNLSFRREDFITYLEQDSRYYFVVEEGNRLARSGGFNVGLGTVKLPESHGI